MRGTRITVHARGCTHDEFAQDQLMERPGQQLLALGWRIASLDYEEGTAGSQDVLKAAGAELARRTSTGPGVHLRESAGGQSRLSRHPGCAIDCLIALRPARGSTAT